MPVRVASSPPSASPGRRPAGSATSSTRSRARSAAPWAVDARSTSTCPATGPCRSRRHAARPPAARSGSVGPRRGATVTIVDVAGERLPAAAGRPPARLRPRRPSMAHGRRRLTPTTPGASGSLPGGARDAALERDRPVDVIHLHDWHTRAGRPLARRWYADDPWSATRRSSLTVHNLAYHGWTPPAALRELGLAPGRRVVARGRRGLDLLRAASSGPKWSTRSSPGTRARP